MVSSVERKSSHFPVLGGREGGARGRRLCHSDTHSEVCARSRGETLLQSIDFWSTRISESSILPESKEACGTVEWILASVEPEPGGRRVFRTQDAGLHPIAEHDQLRFRRDWMFLAGPGSAADRLFRACVSQLCLTWKLSRFTSTERLNSN